MSLFRAIQVYLQQHKYAINAQLLGDAASLAWTKLGYWHNTQHYPTACRQMADHLAQAVDLNASDALLDLGCGRGASLLHWQQQYHVQQLAAVEWRVACVAQIQHHMTDVTVQQGSFLHLKQLFPQRFFDVVLCLDAAYHHSLAIFLASVRAVLQTEGRVAFHYLVLSAYGEGLSTAQQRRYTYLLQAVDIQLHQLFSFEDTLKQVEDAGFDHVQIEDLSTEVFAGFAHYIQQMPQKTYSVDAFKIQMTAKLCRKLYQDGVIRYVQISAQASKRSV